MDEGRKPFLVEGLKGLMGTDEPKNEFVPPHLGMTLNFNAPCDVQITHGDRIEVHIHCGNDAEDLLCVNHHPQPESETQIET